MSEHRVEQSESGRSFQLARIVVERMLQERLFLKGMHKHRGHFSPKLCRGSKRAGDPHGLTARNGSVVGAQPVEGASELMQLLRSHREALEEEMKELRRRTEEFEKEMDKGEKDRAWMRQCIDQLLLQTKRGDVCSRLEVAERTLALKQDQIERLRNELQLQRSSLEAASVLAAQAEMRRADFLAEREARAKVNEEKKALQERLDQALAEVDRLKQEATSRCLLECSF